MQASFYVGKKAAAKFHCPLDVENLDFPKPPRVESEKFHFPLDVVKCGKRRFPKPPRVENEKFHCPLDVENVESSVFQSHPVWKMRNSTFHFMWSNVVYTKNKRTWARLISSRARSRQQHPGMPSAKSHPPSISDVHKSMISAAGPTLDQKMCICSAKLLQKCAFLKCFDREVTFLSQVGPVGGRSLYGLSLYGLSPYGLWLCGLSLYGLSL